MTVPTVTSETAFTIRSAKLHMFNLCCLDASSVTEHRGALSTTG